MGSDLVRRVAWSWAGSSMDACMHESILFVATFKTTRQGNCLQVAMILISVPNALFVPLPVQVAIPLQLLKLTRSPSA